MYDKNTIDSLTSFIATRNGIADKAVLSQQVQQEFLLVRDRSVFLGKAFAIRFCKAVSRGFSNTVLSLSMLQKYDNQPFIVCVVTEKENFLMLANATFLKKVSHSSQELRIDNIKGSFNGGDIMRLYEGVENTPANFEFLYSSHENYSFQENLERLVSATNHIRPTGIRFTPSEEQRDRIYQSIDRAVKFISSTEYLELDRDLSNRVRAVASEIVIAAFIDNVNLRGRFIEYLITAPGHLKSTLIDALHTGAPLPQIFTSDDLGDYERKFDGFFTKTDIKTKVLFLSSNPKGYNIDKLLSFLSEEDSVYLVYVVAINADRSIETKLCSMYHKQLLSGTRIISHWAGRNSRGVTQYDGTALEKIVTDFEPQVDVLAAKKFLDKCLENEPI